MKRSLPLLLALACVWALATPVRASASEYGMYVAPRFIYGGAVFDKMKWNLDAEADSVSRSKEKHDDAFGGALAVGYNFKPRFDLPLRAEVEYSIFSQMNPKSGLSEYTSWDTPGAVGHRTDTDSVKQKVDVQTLFFNFYADIPTETRFTPFVTAGLGMAFVRSKANYAYREQGNNHIKGPNRDVPFEDTFSSGSSGRSDTNFAWNVGAGLGIEIVEDLSLDVAYRFAYLGEVKNRTMDADTGSLSSKTENLYMHQVMVGLRLEF